MFAFLTGIVLFIVGPAFVHAFFKNNGPVTKLTSKNHRQFTRKTGYPVIVKYFATWCGHCQKFAPEFEKAAKQGKSEIRFGAVDCDAERDICTRAGVKGFPTIKAYYVTDSGKSKVKNYQYERMAEPLLKFARELVPNLVRRIDEKKSGSHLNDFLKHRNESLPKLLVLKKDAKQFQKILHAVAIEHHMQLLVGEVIDGKLEKADIQLISPVPGSTLVKYEPEDGKLTKSGLLKFLLPHVEASRQHAIKVKTDKKGKSSKKETKPTESKEDKKKSDKSDKKKTTKTDKKEPKDEL